MASNNKKQQVTILGRESKILLLQILKQGYITQEQKQAFSSLLNVDTNAMFFVYNKEQLEETKRIIDEITDDMVRKNQLPNDLVSFQGSPTREQIDEVLNERFSNTEQL